MLPQRERKIGLLLYIFRVNANKQTTQDVLKRKPILVKTNVSRFGLAVRRYTGKQRDLGSNPLRLSLLISCGLWTLS